MINTAFAYTLLEALPGNITEVSKLSDYLSWLFTFALAAAAFLAVLQIVIGGLQIISGGASETARSNAKKRIQDALWGLLLAFGAVLILETISPGQFTNLSLSITPVTIEAPAPTSATSPGTPPGSITWPPGSPPAGTYSDSEARGILATNGITVNKADCVAINQGNCTSLYGLPKSTVENLKDLAEHAKESFVITGGTEYWLHQTHGPGKPIVDIRYDSSLIDDINALQAEGKIASYQCENGGVKVSCSGTPDHFHVVFK